MTEGKVYEVHQEELNDHETIVIADEIVPMFKCCIWTKYIGFDYFIPIQTSKRSPTTLFISAQNAIRRFISQDNNLKVEIVGRRRKYSIPVIANLRHDVVV